MIELGLGCHLQAQEVREEVPRFKGGDLFVAIRLGLGLALGLELGLGLFVSVEVDRV